MNITQNNTPEMAAENAGAVKGLYEQFCKPKLADLIALLKLNISYTRGVGNYLYYMKESGDAQQEIPVLDLVSGFGANLLGHNHPELKQYIIEALNRDVPMFSQLAVRTAAGKLGEKLNKELGNKGVYYCTFTNSGTESTEAAIKHAYKVRFDTIKREYERITRELNALYHHIEDNHIPIQLPEGKKDLSKYRDDIDEYNLGQFEIFQNFPVLCAVKGSFHGKTVSSLKVTFNKIFRESFEGLSSIKPAFIDIDKPERLPEIVENQVIQFFVPELINNRIELKRYPLTKVFGFIFEVILGEGGVKVISDATLQKLADLHPVLGIPYIIDEIQTGSGRTGSIFLYKETPLSAIEPEYILLSKALGGGIAKIGVMMAHENIYDHDFGLLHTSTFAEDELSGLIALKALDIMTRDNHALLEQVKEQGEVFKTKLTALQAKYPLIIKSVRGRGLMLGLEFHDLSGHSPFFRYAGRQGFISLIIASYILHYHNIRLLAPLTTLFKGNPGKKRQSILRIQPPAGVTNAEIDRLLIAFEEVFKIIQCNNEYCLIGHMIGEQVTEQQRLDPENIGIIYHEQEPNTDFNSRIGFVSNVSVLQDLIDYYFPSFMKYRWDAERLEIWWNGMSRYLEPELLRRFYITSDGFTVEANVISVGYLPKHIGEVVVAARKRGISLRIFLKEMRDKVQDALIVARDLGDERIPTAIVGLGAFTSIITDNCMTLNDYEIPVTSGNSYTTMLMLQSIMQAANEHNMSVPDKIVGVVGAAGNIGAATAAYLARYCAKIYLIGKNKNESMQRLIQVRNQCLTGLMSDIRYQLIEQGRDPETIEVFGLGHQIYRDILYPLLKGVKEPGSTEQAIIDALQNTVPAAVPMGAELDTLINHYYETEENPFIRITEIECLKECDIVACATSSADKNLLNPGMVKKGALVCDASVPSNLSEEFKLHNDEFFILKGGYAKLPEDSCIDFVGMPGGDRTFGCFAETLLLGFDGRNHSFTKGALTESKIEKTLQMAEAYGFTLGGILFRDDLGVNS